MAQISGTVRFWIVCFILISAACAFGKHLVEINILKATHSVKKLISRIGLIVSIQG